MLAAMLACATVAPVHSQPPAPSSLPHASDAATIRALRSALRELDRFLDHHPMIEDDLRREPQRLESASYLAKNPELRSLLATNRAIASAFATERRHLLHRALARQAGAVIHRSDVAQLDTYLDHEPAVERMLTDNPSLIRDEHFLRLHPPLREFMAAHPTLSRAFLPAAPVAQR